MRVGCYYCLACLFLILNSHSTTAQPPVDYSTTAKLSTTWFNTDSLPNSVGSTDGSLVRPILPLGIGSFNPRPAVQITSGLAFACGFYCNGPCTSYLFAVFIVQIDSDGVTSGYLNYSDPQVVWSANRDNPVSYGATLNFTATGELVLRDTDGSMVWATNTTGKSIAGLNLTGDGNLVLFDIDNSTVWQSFDYPTDCLVLGQALFQGQQLIPSVSSTNWTTQKDLFSLQMKEEGLFAYVGSNPPQEYYRNLLGFGTYTDTGRKYVRFSNGSLSSYIFSKEPSDPNDVITIPQASSAQYMKLMPDGHLRVFEFQNIWTVVADLFTEDYLRECDYPMACGNYLRECDYPMACGRYGICSGKQQCSCPGIEYFIAVDDRQPNLGCMEITHLTCNATQDQVLIEVENVTYFNILADTMSVDMETCKQACLNNCSCKAAIFHNHTSNSSNGECNLLSEVFTMMIVDLHVTHSAFLKVQIVRSNVSSPKSRSNLEVILTSTIGSVMFLLGAIVFFVYIIRKRRKATQMEEEYIEDVPEMPTRFAYEELKLATENFNKKLGEGGFGAVYEGTLEDGAKIAVKCLEGLGHVMKSFLAEVKSIGSIHHVNLVRLRGFCAWKSQRFLVYEFMSNTSLDRWIYHGDREYALDWECRKKIILDVAKGLAYLHEECRQKIIHLDIKPQNILLDNNFNAKVSDFGLSKLIDRNQTQVLITMRGTPGYMAPEWLSSVITEKVDVYSFGIVLLETLCGRKNFDRSQPEESWHLLVVLQKSWEQGMLVDMVDKYSDDMQIHAQEVVEIIKVASWCLQCDFTKRPSMSTVVKVLEGVMKVECSLDYNFIDPRLQKTAVKHEKDMTPMLDSVLSGPR